MATTEWTTKSQAISGDSGSAIIRAVADFIVTNCGLTLDTEESASTSLTINMECPSVPGLGFRLSGDPSKAAPSVSLYAGYKDSKDDWVSLGTVLGTWTNVSTSVISIACVYKNIGDFKVYRLSGINKGSTSVSGGGPMFATFSAVDYFSGKSRKGFFYGSGGFSAQSLYNDDIKAAEALTGLVNAAVYPSQRLLTVAHPVVYKSDYFYGFIGSSTTLYNLNLGTTTAAGTQVQLAGHTFECLSGATWVRLN